MTTLYLMCGVSRAGKTTKAKELEKETGAFRVSLDDWRVRLRHSFFMHEADSLALEYTRLLLEHGFSVIFDNMNLTKREREYILSQIPNSVKKICVFMNTDFEIVKLRGGAISPRHLESPTMEEGFNQIITFEENK